MAAVVRARTASGSWPRRSILVRCAIAPVTRIRATIRCATDTAGRCASTSVCQCSTVAASRQINVAAFSAASAPTTNHQARRRGCTSDTMPAVRIAGRKSNRMSGRPSPVAIRTARARMPKRSSACPSAWACASVIAARSHILAPSSAISKRVALAMSTAFSGRGK